MLVYFIISLFITVVSNKAKVQEVTRSNRQNDSFLENVLFSLYYEKKNLHENM